MKNIELQEQESLDKKRDRIEGLKKSTNGEKDEATRGFDDLASELSRPKNNDKYTTEELKTAATKRIDKMVQSKTGNLNNIEQQQLDELKTEMMKSLNTTENPIKLLEEYSKIRDKITGIIAAADGGKQQATEKGKEQLLEAEKMSNDMTQDAFDQFKEFLNTVFERKQEEQKKVQQQVKTAKVNGDTEIMQAKMEAGGTLGKWPA